MKLFNPFKMHIASTSGGNYVIREWMFVWWYKDNGMNLYWWHDNTCVNKWCLFRTLKCAQDKLAYMSYPKIKSKYYES